MVKRLAVVILTEGSRTVKPPAPRDHIETWTWVFPVRIEDATVTERYEGGRSVDGRLNSVAVK